MNNKWLKLSDGLYLFGNGGVSKIERADLLNCPNSPYITILYGSNNVKITSVKESIEELLELLHEKI